MKKELPSWAYKVAIVMATIIWGYSFVSMKGVVAVIPPAWLLGFRFLFAGIVLTVILWKRVREAFSGKCLPARCSALPIFWRSGRKPLAWSTPLQASTRF